MSIKRIKPAYFLGASNITDPKVLGSKVDEMIVQQNLISNGAVITGTTITASTLLNTNSISETTALANITVNSALIEKHATAAINATATATAAQVKTGYITSTSAAATTITLPTGTLLGTALGAVKGTIFHLYVDNTAGANTVTIAVAVNGILSAGAVAVAGTFGLLTVASGITGQSRFTLMFSSATAYTFTRTA